MLFLHKLLPIFVLPLGVVFLLLLVAVIRRKRWPAVLATVVLYVSSIGPVADIPLAWLESQYPAVPIAGVGQADAIVVLSGFLGPPVAPGYLPNVSEAIERLEGGIVLHQSGAAPWLVFTGGRVPWDKRAGVEGEPARDAAVARGVPAGQILITPEVGNTADEAKAVAEMMRQRGWKRIILVTTGWHMPRAAWLFRRAEIDCTIFPVDFRRDPDRSITLLDFLPSGGALNISETALREVYANLYYRIFR